MPFPYPGPFGFTLEKCLLASNWIPITASKMQMRVPTWFFLGSYNGFSIEKNQHQLSWHLLGNAGRIHFLQLSKFSKAWIFPTNSMKFSYSRICEKRVSLWYAINPVDFLSSSASVQCICRVPSFCHVFQLIPGVVHQVHWLSYSSRDAGSILTSGTVCVKFAHSSRVVSVGSSFLQHPKNIQIDRLIGFC